MRDRIVELILNAPRTECMVAGRVIGKTFQTAINIADHLIANGVTLNEWRPASDPPKESTERVAVFLQDNPVTATIGRNRIDTDRYLNGKWVRWSTNVTHWMPLPAPPKGEE